MITAERIENNLNQLAYHMGRWTASAEFFAENHHTCVNRHERYPWPLDRDCRACCLVLEKHAKRIHAELAWLLFGFDVMLESWKVEIRRRAEDAEARRNQGAGI